LAKLKEKKNSPKKILSSYTRRTAALHYTQLNYTYLKWKNKNKNKNKNSDIIHKEDCRALISAVAEIKNKK